MPQKFMSKVCEAVRNHNLQAIFGMYLAKGILTL